MKMKKLTAKFKIISETISRISKTQENKIGPGKHKYILKTQKKIIKKLK